MASRENVLVVDDDAVSRHVLKLALHSAGLKTVVVGSGTEALAYLAENLPSVVLLDLVMPPPDGYAVLRWMRDEPRQKDVPVVVLTALDADDDVARAFGMGADDFVRKPFRPAELVARIRSQLRMREYVEQIARREHDAKVVLELTQALSSTLDVRAVLFTVVRRIAEVLRVERCSIVLVGEPGGVGYVVAASDDREIRDLPIDLAKYPEIRNVLETGEPLVIGDAGAHPIFQLPPGDHASEAAKAAAQALGAAPDSVVRSAVLATGAFRSLAILPITFEDKAMGVMFLRGHRPFALHEHELSLARTVANATAIAVRNARLLQSLRDQSQQSAYARFEAEQRLSALQPYFDFFQSSADGIVVMDAEGQVLFSNPQAHEITGRRPDQLDRAPLSAVLDPRDRPALAEIRAGTSRGVYPRMVDLAIVRAVEAGPEQRVLSVSFGQLSREHSGEVLVSFRDVTAERATEAELRKTKEFLERVIESSADAIVSCDMSGRVLLYNRAAERVYGYDARDVVGRMNVRDLYPEGVAHEIMRRIVSRQHGGAGRLEGHRTEVLAKDGVRIPVMLSAALILDEGTPIGSVGIFTDLRERLRMEARLEQAQEELRTREKQAIVAELAGAAAHELNQPLQSVLGYAELVRRLVPPDSRLSNAAASILTEAERMAEIVRKVGKITRYETKSYVGSSTILDLDKSSIEAKPPPASLRSERKSVPPGAGHDRKSVPPTSGPGGGQSVQ